MAIFWGLSQSPIWGDQIFQLIGHSVYVENQLLGLGASHGIEKHPIVEIAAT